MHTPEFRRLLVEYVPDDNLMALRFATKPWMREIENLLRRIFANGGLRGELLIHNGNDIRYDIRYSNARLERIRSATRVKLLLNITKIGGDACNRALSLIVVDTPEGISSIGEAAFDCCGSLTYVSFPTTLAKIEGFALHKCGLENVDLLHTNLQELGHGAFDMCMNLERMTIPDSLQTIGKEVFSTPSC
ncbi:hypothetical protein TrLO_g14408 [Triparma laevis f. longispina]|uniref:Uncharacterized protein n=1 Tax=Triparma laevis f. longispina TaxID=1714387 RepID=A0A9W6Z7L6_9STRA|nr:hypothetical protein TrLO_g14408 [Triparma laevis f. longispina]